MSIDEIVDKQVFVFEMTNTTATCWKKLPGNTSNTTIKVAGKDLKKYREDGYKMPINLWTDFKTQIIAWSTLVAKVRRFANTNKNSSLIHEIIHMFIVRYGLTISLGNPSESFLVLYEFALFYQEQLNRKVLEATPLEAYSTDEIIFYGTEIEISINDLSSILCQPTFTDFRAGINPQVVWEVYHNGNMYKIRPESDEIQLMNNVSKYIFKIYGKSRKATETLKNYIEENGSNRKIS